MKSDETNIRTRRAFDLDRLFDCDFGRKERSVKKRQREFGMRRNLGDADRPRDVARDHWIALALALNHDARRNVGRIVKFNRALSNAKLTIQPKIFFYFFKKFQNLIFFNFSKF